MSDTYERYATTVADPDNELKKDPGTIPDSREGFIQAIAVPDDEGSVEADDLERWLPESIWDKFDGQWFPDAYSLYFISEMKTIQDHRLPCFTLWVPVDLLDSVRTV